MKKELKKLAFGFLIAFLDFRLGTFNILPDIIGYLMIYSALSNFSPSENGRLAKGAAIFLAIFSLPDIIMPPQLTLDHIGTLHFGWQLYTSVLHLVQVFLVVNVLKALSIIVNEQGFYTEKKWLEDFGKVYLIVNLILIFMGPIGYLFSFELLFLVGFSFIVGFIIHVIFIVRLFQIRAKVFK